MLRTALAATLIAGAALATTAAPAAASTALETGTRGAAGASTATPSTRTADVTAAGVVDYSLRNFRCNGDSVGIGSYQVEFGRSGVVQFGTKYQLQVRNSRWVNVRGGAWSKSTDFFPNDLRNFEVYFPQGASTYRYWTPTYVGDYRIVVTHKFRTVDGVWNIAKQATPACAIR